MTFGFSFVFKNLFLFQFTLSEVKIIKLLFTPISQSSYLKKKETIVLLCFLKHETCSYFRQPSLFLMVANIIDGEGQGNWYVAVHGVVKSQTGLSDWTSTMVLNSSFVSFLPDFPFPSILPASPLSPCLHLPFRMCPHLLYPSLPSKRQSPFLHSLQILLPPSLPTFCWVATFKVLKFSKSLIVCPNLERRSIKNNKPEKQNVLQKIFQLKDIKWTQYDCWQRMKKAIHRTTNNNLLSSQGYEWFRDEQGLIPALEYFKYSTENTVCLYLTLIKSKCVRSWFVWQTLTPTLWLELQKTQKWIPHGLHPQGT